MLNIVIIGAGDVGGHLAELLSKARHNVVVVDKDKEKLDRLSWQIDMATRLGSGTDWKLLDELSEINPDILLALTDSDEVNFVACSIAKHLGYPSTLARVKDDRFLNRNRLDFSRIFDIDYFVAPELLCAYDMYKYVMSEGALLVENFAHGAVQLQILEIPRSWKKGEVPLRQLKLPDGVMVGLIKRKTGKRLEDYKLLFPHGDDLLIPGDEVTFIGETDAMEALRLFIGISGRSVKTAVVVGGSIVGVNLARLLDRRGISVRLVEKDYDKCLAIADQFSSITVMNHNASDKEFLLSEKIGQADLVAFCTQQDETNVMGALLVKEAGAKDVVTILSNESYEGIIQGLGISHVSSPRFSAANRVLSQILTGIATSLISLYDNKVEVLEVTVSAESRLVGIPLVDLGPLLPKDFLIAMIQNRGRLIVASGSRIISPGDTVIVITDPKHIPEIEKVF